MQFRLRLNGEEVYLVMDYARLQLLEERLGGGIMAIAALLSRGDLPLHMMVEMVRVFASEKLEIYGLGERVMRAGICKVAEDLASFLVGALAGDGEQDELVAYGLSPDIREMMVRFPD